MGGMFDQVRFRDVFRLVSFAAVGVLVMWCAFELVRSLQWMLVAVASAFLLSLSGEPAVSFLMRRRWSRPTAAGFVLVGMLALLVGLVWLVVPGARVAVDLALSRSDEVLRGLSTYLGGGGSFLSSARSWVDGISVGSFTEVLSGRWDIYVGAARVVGESLTTLFFLYYFLAEGPSVYRFVLRAVPERVRPMVLRMWDLALVKAGKFLYGQMLVSLVAGLVTWVLCLLFGVPVPLAFGAWAFVMAIVPVVGGSLSVLLPVLVVVGVDVADGSGLSRALLLTVSFVAYQLVENYVIRPRLMAHTLQMHPVSVFVAVIVGVVVLGPVGAIVALPVAAVVQAMAAEWSASMMAPNAEVSSKHYLSGRRRQRGRAQPADCDVPDE